MCDKYDESSGHECDVKLMNFLSKGFCQPKCWAGSVILVFWDLVLWIFFFYVVGLGNAVGTWILECLFNMLPQQEFKDDGFSQHYQALRLVGHN